MTESFVEPALQALADPQRREIFERIVVRPQRVTDLAKACEINQPLVSHHLKVLREVGLVENRDGRLAPCVDMLPRLRAYFERLWLEAVLGDGWLKARRVKNSDLGL